MYGVAQENVVASQKMRKKQLTGRNLPGRRKFMRHHQELRASGSFYSSRHDMCIGKYRSVLAMEVALMRTLADRLSTVLRVV